jgi:hypothetical protein
METLGRSARLVDETNPSFRANTRERFAKSALFQGNAPLQFQIQNAPARDKRWQFDQGYDHVSLRTPELSPPRRFFQASP